MLVASCPPPPTYDLINQELQSTNHLLGRSVAANKLPHVQASNLKIFLMLLMSRGLTHVKRKKKKRDAQSSQPKELSDLERLKCRGF